MLVIVGMMWLMSGWILSYASAATSQTDVVAAVQISNLTERMNRTDAENVRRFDHVETMLQYLLGGQFLSLGAHGIQVSRSRKGRTPVPNNIISRPE